MSDGVYKRGKKWYFCYDAPPKPDGRRNKKSKVGGRTRKEALRARNEALHRLHHGTWSEDTKKTVAEYLRAWLAAREVAGLRRNTIVGYEVMIERHLVPALGALPLSKLTTLHLDSLYAELLTSGRKDRNGGLSARTVRAAHTVMRRALADAVRKGSLERNVAQEADPPSPGVAKADAERARASWTQEELRQFLASVREHRLCAAFWLSATTGMRRGELLGLRWRDLDLEHADGPRLSVVQTLVEPRVRARQPEQRSYELSFAAPKTRQGRRVIDLDAETASVLREHRKRQLEERLAFGPDYADSGLVFTREDGSPIVPHTFGYFFDQAVKKAGLRKIRLHDLRHTHASLLARDGTSPKVIQERLGHHSAGFTLDYYTHSFPSQQREAAKRFGSMVQGDASAGSP